ncbi:MAG TPA: ABC transporter permease [Bacteroidales bacterium]|nr:ABC transporter permease [Bacteroidales bacterium]HRX95627.1 ABC transporter permease [Bacteroidales bacterium]
MNFELFIASRIVSKGKSGFTRPIIRLSVFSITLGIAVMILAIAILTGFQQQVRNKVIGFGGHIQITAYDVTTSAEANPISNNQSFYPSLDSFPGVKHIEVFADKAGIIKTDDQIEGVLLKGVGADFDWSWFKDRIVEGNIIQLSDTGRSDDVIISKSLASRLEFKVGDPLRMYFINSSEAQPRGRKFKISGIYETGLEEFDRLYILGDITHVQKLNNWEPDQVGGFEVYLDSYQDMDEMGQQIDNLVGVELKAQTIRQLHPQIFEWLSLHDMNVIIIIILMVLVSGITMISTLLILILEKTNMIGTLKALGTKNSSIRKVFIYNAVYIIGRGMIWGNAIAIGLSLLQLKFGIFKLNQESYYVSEVPVNLDLTHYLLINFGTLIACTLMLIIPSFIITKISPVKAIRFD